MAIITIAIILLTSVTSIIAFPPNVPAPESLRRTDWFAKYLFNAPMILKDKQYYRLLSYGFIHANWWHLFFNMLTLWFFGPFVEKSFKYLFGHSGGIIFITFYLLSIVISTIPDLIKFKDKYYYNAVGASGAISAVVFSAILFQPNMKLFFIFLPIPITAWIFGLLYLAYSYYMAKKNIDNIGHSAHLWGAIFGFIFPILLKPGLLPYFFNQIF